MPLRKNIYSKRTESNVTLENTEPSWWSFLWSIQRQPFKIEGIIAYLSPHDFIDKRDLSGTILQNGEKWGQEDASIPYLQSTWKPYCQIPFASVTKDPWNLWHWPHWTELLIVCATAPPWRWSYFCNPRGHSYFLTQSQQPCTKRKSVHKVWKRWLFI